MTTRLHISTRLLALGAVFIAVAALAPAQKKVPKKEYDGYMAVVNATSPDATIAAADKFVESFADSTLKSQVLVLAADAAERKNDIPKALTYGQTALEADPKNYEAMLLISGELARTTREHDLDMEEKLTRADKMSQDAIEAVNAATKPNATMTDDQWNNHKKDKLAEAHRNLGMTALVRKKYDVAITELKAAVDTGATMEPTNMIRLAGAYDQAGKPDEAIAVLDRVLAMPNLPANLKPFATSEKARAEAIQKAKK
jgi:tetratricopeptide (TPR) repeat protein